MRWVSATTGWTLLLGQTLCAAGWMYLMPGGFPIDHPRFWAEVKSRHPGARDFIEDPAQDGYGIGVLEWGGAS